MATSTRELHVSAAAATLLAVGCVACGAFAPVQWILALAAISALFLAAQGHGGSAITLVVGFIAVAGVKFITGPELDLRAPAPAPAYYEVVPYGQAQTWPAATSAN